MDVSGLCSRVRTVSELRSPILVGIGPVMLLNAKDRKESDDREHNDDGIVWVI